MNQYSLSSRLVSEKESGQMMLWVAYKHDSQELNGSSSLTSNVTLTTSTTKSWWDCWKRKINDERFIALIGWMLQAGYTEDWKFNKTYSGTPQGGVISPILANVYLHELDVFMKDLCQRTHKGKERKVRKEFKRLDNLRVGLRVNLDRMKDDNLEICPENRTGARNPYAGLARG